MFTLMSNRNRRRRCKRGKKKYFRLISDNVIAILKLQQYFCYFIGLSSFSTVFWFSFHYRRERDGEWRKAHCLLRILYCANNCGERSHNNCCLSQIHDENEECWHSMSAPIPHTILITSTNERIRGRWRKKTQSEQ